MSNGHVHQVQPLLRFTTLLHKRVHIDLLSKPLPAPMSDAILDALPPQSHTILVALEDVVATLYAPQNAPSIASAISPLASSVEGLRATIMPILPSTGTDSAPPGSQGTQRDVRKWFITCFEQIDKLSRNLTDSLPQTDSTPT